MPRPKKWRRVCKVPEIKAYGPVDRDSIDNLDSVILTVEELETIRLIDLEGMNQVECAELMGVARSTVQRIYNDARKKIAKGIIEGRTLKIEGGNYKVCNTDLDMERCNNCFRKRHRHGRKYD
ncbi:DUF134 domain-containing protein [Maledivibacter halophilus]|nr:DUF134 domain-containing protein [Maledivibacter halophilus]